MARAMKDSSVEWIGLLPNNFKIMRCKYISEFLNGYAFDSNDLKTDFIYPVIRIGDIKGGSIDAVNCQGVNTNVGLSKYQIKNNDILLAMSGATVGKVGIAKNTNNSYINQRVGIIRTRYAKFLFYCLYTKPFIEYIVLKANGSAQPNVSGSVYGEFKIPFPPIDEQNKIAEYLDKKCGEIDAITAKIQEQIATLEEYKKSVISETVTKGLNPNAPMKDSGIECIGKIPANWEIKKGKYCLSYLQKPVKQTDEVITCFRDGQVTLRKNRREDGFTMSDKEIGYQGIDVGDLIVHGMDGFAGAIGISDSRGKASPVLNVLDTNQNKSFIMYYLRSMAYNGVFIALATGIRVRTCDTNWGKLKELPYPLPSKEEQDRIVDYINKRLSQTNDIIADKQKQIETLEEYKKTLIYEYVTGKKEVA